MRVPEKLSAADSHTKSTDSIRSSRTASLDLGTRERSRTLSLDFREKGMCVCMYHL